MNINKAIEIKELEGEEFLNADPDEIDEADRLSIEALKAVDLCRRDVSAQVYLLLPGETID